MNYYEKIIQEKRNNSQVIERGQIKGVEYFIEKITETVKYPRPFEQVRYIGKLKKDGKVVSYTPRHERIDTCKRALEELAQEHKANSLINMEHQDQPTFKIPNVVKQYATDILLKYPDITITEMEKFLRNKFQLDLTKDQIRYAAYQLMLKPNGECLMKENAKYDYNLISKGSNKWIIQVKYGTKVVDEQLFTGTETEARYKGQKNVDYFEVRHKPGMNSKGYYESIIEQKNANTSFKGHTPEDDAKRLTALEPIVKSLKRKGMSPKDIAIELEKKTRPELARQAVQAFYD